MTAQSQQLVATVLPQELQGAAAELGLYLSDSLGELCQTACSLLSVICKRLGCVAVLGASRSRRQRLRPRG